MKEQYCEYSKYVKEGLDQYLLCSRSNTYCKYQRLCPTKRKVVHTDKYKNCSILRAEEEKDMAKNSNNKKVSEVKETFIEERNSAEEKKIEVKKEKILATVVLATPLYYVINKDGNNVKIAEKNKYKIGDIIEI